MECRGLTRRAGPWPRRRLQVVALEMRPDYAAKCETNARARAVGGNATVTVLNKAAAVASGSGLFNRRGDSSHIMAQVRGEAGGPARQRGEPDPSTGERGRCPRVSAAALGD